MIRQLALWLLLALGLAAPAGGGRGAPRAPRRVALLIGIADYEHFSPTGPPGQSRLSGPVHDVERMRISLRRYGFDGPDDVHVLTNAQASRAGIAAGFRWLAERANDTADIAVIFYSGHGSYTKDLNGDEKLVTPGDTLDEALVPWDARDIHDPNQLVIDDQIAEWLKAIHTTKLTIIIDACFSGTATRGEEVSSLARPKGAPGNTSAGSQQAQLVDNLPYSLITASSATETAAEKPLGDNNMVFGVLTYYLTRALDAADSSTMHYDEVVQQVSAEMRGARVAQTPQLEGDRSALLFHIRGAVARRPFVVMTAAGRGRASIDVGAVSGVRRNGLYDVYPPGEMAFQGRGVLGHLVVDSVGDLRSWGALDGVDSIPAGSRATLARVPRGARSRDAISVRVEAGAQVRAAVESVPFVSWANSSSADVLVRDTAGVVRVYADGIPLPPLPEDSARVRRATVGGKVLEGYAPTKEALCPPLARALAIAAFRDIENPSPPLGIRFDVSLRPSGQTPVARPPARPDVPDTAYIGRTYDLWVQVHATEASTLYLSAAVEGFAGTPGVIYPSGEGMNQPVALNAWVLILRDVKMVEPPGLEVVKFYVGSDQYDFNALLASLRGCEPGAARRGIDRGPPGTPEPVVGWNAWDYGTLVLRPR